MTPDRPVLGAGPALRCARIGAGVSVDDIARVARVKASVIAAIERADRIPTEDEVQRYGMAIAAVAAGDAVERHRALARSRGEEQTARAVARTRAAIGGGR